VESLPSRRQLIDVVALHTCTRNCFGIADYAASCCQLAKRDWIQGPVPDAEEFLLRLATRFGSDMPFDEVFIRFEEGAAMFPERSVWQDPANFPAIRPVVDAAAKYPCPFLGVDDRCGVYEDRPNLCREYRCEHLQKVLDLL
jgi:Fe-S-cluster containining protein